jgi:Mg2+ and Co2+ transporter CorA
MSNNVRTLREFHDSVRKKRSESQNLTNNSSFIFLEQLGELGRLLERVDALRSELHGIADLVASFLDLRNGFALQSLAKDSAKENEEVRKLNESMHKLTEGRTQDSAVVKVLTILTLICLPATVVSNFFPTSFVNSVSSPTAPAHIVISNGWWIFHCGFRATDVAYAVHLVLLDADTGIWQVPLVVAI